MQEVGFTGTDGDTETFKMKYKAFFRETDVTQNFLQITDITREGGEASYQSDFSGYIGIAPWSSEDPHGD